MSRTAPIDQEYPNRVVLGTADSEAPVAAEEDKELQDLAEAFAKHLAKIVSMVLLGLRNCSCADCARETVWNCLNFKSATDNLRFLPAAHLFQLLAMINLA